MPNAPDNMKHRIQLLTITIAASLTSCDFIDKKLVVVNNTKDSIAFIIPAEPNYFPTFDNSKDPRENKELNEKLLNTIAKYDPEKESFGGVHFLVGDSSKHVSSFNIKWEAIVNRTSDKKLKILFCPSNVLTTGRYTWKTIYDNKMFTVEKDLSVEELEKLNWTITYK